MYYIIAYPKNLLDKVINDFKSINYTYGIFCVMIKSGIVRKGIMWYNNTNYVCYTVLKIILGGRL